MRYLTWGYYQMIVRKMQISYAITVKDELSEIQKLVSFLLEHKRVEDEIVILYDSANGSSEVESFLRSKSVNGAFSWHKGEFKGHFAEWKNKLTSLCSGDWILNIDADEIPHKNLMVNLPAVLETNPDTDVFWVPRVNTVEGLTEQDIKNWRWRVNEKGHVNWPDPQMRIYRNVESIEWEKKVHETLKGYNSYAMLPQKEEWSLYHPKDIERQRKQNNYYNTL